MNDHDPFLSLLGDSLATPDLELAAAAREHLLAEAGKAPPPGVVPLVTEEAWQVTAFNWLLGEQPTDAALLDRLTRDSAFSRNVAGQLAFLRQLRPVLRPAAAMPLPVPERAQGMGRGWKQLVTAGIAAAITWMLVLTIPSGVSTGSSPNLAAGSPSTAGDGNPPSYAKPQPPPSGMAERQVPGFAESSNPSPRAGKDRRSLDVDSVRHGADVLDFPEATRLAARELFAQGHDGFASANSPADPGVEALVAVIAERPGSQFQGAHRAEWLLAQQLLTTGQAFQANLSEKTVPEPSGLLLVAVGSLALLARRWRPLPSSCSEFKETRLPPRRFYGRRSPAE